MLRHSWFLMYGATTTLEQRFEMLKDLAFLRSECAGPMAGDYGDDLFAEAVPTETWRGLPHKVKLSFEARRFPTLAERSLNGSTGMRQDHEQEPPCDYDAALHVDFKGEAEYTAYQSDETLSRLVAHHRGYLEGALTAHVNWWYDGDPLIRPGLIRHSAMFIWSDNTDEAQRRATLEAPSRFEDAPGVVSVTTGTHYVGTVSNRLRCHTGPGNDYDWLFDVQLVDRDATERFLKSQLYADVMRTVAQATKYNWTARLSHVMRGPWTGISAGVGLLEGHPRPWGSIAPRP
jgi:hypothetical protein